MNTTPTRPFYRWTIEILPVPTLLGSLAIFAILFIILSSVLNFTVDMVLIGALLGTVLHWSLEMIHHLGHAYLAQRTGYPMLGVRIGMLGILAMSLYPKTEPKLPASVHIRRALGGPIASGICAVIFLVLVLATAHLNDVLAWLFRLGLFESLLMSVGALAPLPGIDGGTILHYWRKRS